MSWDWKREFERQHGKLPGAGKGAAAAADAGEPAPSPTPQSRTPRAACRPAVAAPPRVEARKAEPKRKGKAKLRRPEAVSDPILSLLLAGDIAHLDAMAREAGKDRAQLAADLLGDLIADDAEAHEVAA